MMGDPFRKMESTSSTYSPKSSPHGGRSPVVSRQDSSGTLKTTISLGKTPTIIHTGPFYLMKEPPGKGELTGDKDLMTEYGLHHTLTKFKDKKVKESLASFLPNLPSINDDTGDMENSTLRSIIEKPPITGKELRTLNSVQLAGFRLHPGPLPERFRVPNITPTRKHKNKKKNKHKDGAVVQETALTDFTSLEIYEKKHKKQKRHEDDKERKKRKKEKKRKKKSHSPEPSSSSGLGNASNGIGLTSSVGFGLGSNVTPSSNTGSTLSSLTATLAGSVLTPHQLPSLASTTPTLTSQTPLSAASSLLGAATSSSSIATTTAAAVAAGFGAMLSGGATATSTLGSSSSSSGFMSGGFGSSNLTPTNLGNTAAAVAGSSGPVVSTATSSNSGLLSQHSSIY